MRGSDFAELKAFVAVVERQSFARAAERRFGKAYLTLLRREG